MQGLTLAFEKLILVFERINFVFQQISCLSKTLLENVILDPSFFQFLFFLEQLDIYVVDPLRQGKQLLLIAESGVLSRCLTKALVVFHQDRMSVTHDLIFLAEGFVQLFDVFNIVFQPGVFSLRR